MRSAIAVALIIVGWVATPARAGSSIGVVAAGDGNASPVAAAEIKDWLERTDNTVVGAGISPNQISQMDDCLVVGNVDCLREVMEKNATVSTIVYVRADGEGTPMNFRLSLYWLAKGQKVVSQSGDCRRCVTQQLKQNLDDLITKLAGTVLGVGHVQIRSTPTLANVAIDGRPLATTPLNVDLPAGKHTIAITLDNHPPEQRVIVLRRDQTEVVEASFAAAGGAGAWRTPKRLGLIAMSAGSVALISGAVLIAVDQRPGGAAPKIITDSLRYGVPLSIAGAAALGVGAYLWMHDSKTPSPVVAVSPRGAYVGWSTAF